MKTKEPPPYSIKKSKILQIFEKVYFNLTEVKTVCTMDDKTDHIHYSLNPLKEIKKTK